MKTDNSIKQKISGVMDMLEKELQVLTAIEQGRIMGGDSGASSGPGCDPLNSGSMVFMETAEAGSTTPNGIYNDNGKLAFGFGHDLTPNEQLQYNNGTFDTSSAHAVALFQSDLQSAEDYVNSHLTNTNVTQGEYQAAVDIAFNAGQGALGNSQFLADLNAGDITDARNELINWNASGSAGQDTRIANRLRWFDYQGADPGSITYDPALHTDGWNAVHS